MPGVGLVAEVNLPATANPLASAHWHYDRYPKRLNGSGSV